MLITVYTWLCDNCGRTYSTSSFPLQLATELGWTCEDLEDLCPICTVERSAPWVVRTGVALDQEERCP